MLIKVTFHVARVTESYAEQAEQAVQRKIQKQFWKAQYLEMYPKYH